MTNVDIDPTLAIMSAIASIDDAGKEFAIGNHSTAMERVAESRQILQEIVQAILRIEYIG